MHTVRTTAKLDLSGLHVKISELTHEGGRETLCDPDRINVWFRLGCPPPTRSWIGSADVGTVGSVIIVPAGLPITSESWPGRVVKSAQFGFDVDHFQSISGIQNDWIAGRVYDCSDVRCAQLEFYLRQLIGEVENPQWSTPRLVDALAVAAITVLTRHFETLSQKKGLAAWQIRRVRDYVESHAVSDCRIQHLAGLCGLSTGHFCRVFKESAGLSPHAFVQDIKIGKAKDMLTGTDRPIGRIATELGFAHLSGFDSAFRRAVGETPLKYRLRSRSYKHMPVSAITQEDTDIAGNAPTSP